LKTDINCQIYFPIVNLSKTAKSTIYLKYLGLDKTEDTAFYPAMGDRGVGDGVLYNVNNGDNVFYHTASMSSNAYGIGLLFNANGTYLNPKYGNFISRGSSVRPAAEVTP
jgi:hypothetical protein